MDQEQIQNRYADNQGTPVRESSSIIKKQQAISVENASEISQKRLTNKEKKQMKLKRQALLKQKKQEEKMKKIEEKEAKKKQKEQSILKMREEKEKKKVQKQIERERKRVEKEEARSHLLQEKQQKKSRIQQEKKQKKEKFQEMLNTNEGIPESMVCPISQQLMKSPVISSQCGHSFELASIDLWLKKSSSCPLCKVPLSKKNLTKNFALASLIDDFKKKSLK